MIYENIYIFILLKINDLTYVYLCKYLRLETCLLKTLQNILVLCCRRCLVFLSLGLYCRGKLFEVAEFFETGRWWTLWRGA